MAIETCKSFKTSDGRTFLNREEAQLHEIEILAAHESQLLDPGDGQTPGPGAFAKWIVANKDALLAILSTRKPRVVKAKQKKVVAA